MRYYLINALCLAPVIVLLMVVGGTVGIICASLYALSWLGDLWFSDTPLYRNYPLIGRMHPALRVLRAASVGDSAPYSRGSTHLIETYARGRTPYSSFGQKTLPQSEYTIRHVIFPATDPNSESAVLVGGAHCRRKYSSSILNVSALSFGSITPNAIETLSRSAKIGGYFYNVGEAGVHRRALDGGGDLVLQVGTGYFGCRDANGHFDEASFANVASLVNVKMIEIKISQGSKPALGGFLPASKVSREVSELCGVPLHKDSVLPVSHSAFRALEELPAFVSKLRELCGGKPIGIKMCVGDEREVESLVRTMEKEGPYLDFVAIDGNDGGTGSAPSEYQDSVGLPLYPALTLWDGLLRRYGLREEVRLIAGGKIYAARDIFIALAHGADICVAARPFLIAMGCVQALECGTSFCPAGITSAHARLDTAVQPHRRAVYLANYHRTVLESFSKLLASAGLSSPSEITMDHLYRTNLADGR